VHAFEPNGDLVETLKRSVRLNGFEKRVVIHQTAVAATGEREVPFHITGKGNTGGSSLAMLREEGKAQTGLVVDVRTVSTVSLDEYARRMSLNSCALIKIDVEGAEDLVMQGMSELLRVARPGVIICETRIGSPAHQVLIQAGYAVRQVVDWQPETARNGASPVGNVVYSVETDARA
jgi:FkbM family methyltransferase